MSNLDIPNDLISAGEAEAITGVAPGTFKVWRRRSGGPFPYAVPGKRHERCFLYSRADVEEFKAGYKPRFKQESAPGASIQEWNAGREAWHAGRRQWEQGGRPTRRLFFGPAEYKGFLWRYAGIAAGGRQTGRLRFILQTGDKWRADKSFGLF